MRPGAGLVVAGAWVGPFLAVALGAALLRLAARPFGDGAADGASIGPSDFGLLAFVVAASVLAGVPAAVLAVFRGAVVAPAGIAAVVAALGAMALLRAEGAALPVSTPLVFATGLAAAALAVLWVGLAVARVKGASLWLPGLLGLGAALACAMMAGSEHDGAQGAAVVMMLALALGAAVVALPGAAAGAFTTAPLHAGTAPALAGIAIALAVVAGPGAALLAGGPTAALTLALLVAMPGLLLVASLRGSAPLPPLRLATGLLLLQALVVVLALAAEGAPVAAGLMPAEELPVFRAALLGAAFLPVLAVLLAVLLAAGAFTHAGLAALALALPHAFAAAHGSAFGVLLAPVAATALAAWLVAKIEKAAP